MTRLKTNEPPYVVSPKNRTQELFILSIVLALYAVLSTLINVFLDTIPNGNFNILIFLGITLVIPFVSELIFNFIHKENQNKLFKQQHLYIYCLTLFAFTAESQNIYIFLGAILLITLCYYLAKIFPIIKNINSIAVSGLLICILNNQFLITQNPNFHSWEVVKHILLLFVFAILMIREIIDSHLSFIYLAVLVVYSALGMIIASIDMLIINTLFSYFGFLIATLVITSTEAMPASPKGKLLFVLISAFVGVIFVINKINGLLIGIIVANLLCPLLNKLTVGKTNENNRRYYLVLGGTFLIFTIAILINLFLV